MAKTSRVVPRTVLLDMTWPRASKRTARTSRLPTLHSTARPGADVRHELSPAWCSPRFQFGIGLMDGVWPTVLQGGCPLELSDDELAEGEKVPTLTQQFNLDGSCDISSRQDDAEVSLVAVLLEPRMRCPFPRLRSRKLLCESAALRASAWGGAAGQSVQLRLLHDGPDRLHRPLRAEGTELDCDSRGQRRS
eukprot:scaffold198_cov352-Prasinococcus_capsulatus_cf.AAC.7